MNNLDVKCVVSSNGVGAWVSGLHYPCEIYTDYRGFVDERKRNMCYECFEHSRYLEFILSNWETLPDYMIFLNNRTMGYQNVEELVAKVNSVSLQRGYTSLSGYPILHSRFYDDDAVYRRIQKWGGEILGYFGLSLLPPAMQVRRGSQFMVSRDRVLQYDRSFWEKLRELYKGKSAECPWGVATAMEWLYYKIFTGHDIEEDGLEHESN